MRAFDDYGHAVHVIRCSDLLTLYANKKTLDRWRNWSNEDLYKTTITELNVELAIEFSKQLAMHDFSKDLFKETKIYSQDDNLIHATTTASIITFEGEKAYFIILNEDTDLINAKDNIRRKNVYLKLAAFMIDHDLKTTILTHFSLAIKGLIKAYKEGENILIYLTLLTNALVNGQNIFNGIHEFITLIDPNKKLKLKKENLNIVLKSFLVNTAYRSNVEIYKLPEVAINKNLFLLLAQNLIKNGLKHNDSDDPKIKIYYKDNFLIFEDNGRGLTQERFDYLLRTSTRKGLKIIEALIYEHGWEFYIHKKNKGTLFKIKIND